ncbi:ParM/StbA family protein [Clostridium tetani]|uniref:ParM/StbA family protein n=1 Tax=Clostridium tetani TaxID=1513 RepID=UPI002955D3AA|nr:ParM/StbA family protein [Clostridium tetani]BDR65738.1 hypothetical protein K134307016_p10490 [Clostridium tetani]
MENITNEYVMTLDAGKYETKLIGKNKKGTTEDIKRVIFKTKIYNLEDGYIDIEGNSHKIELDGKEYLIGEQGVEDSSETSKTNLIHKLAAYTAITQVLDSNKNNKVQLVLACPLSVLRNAKAKEEYRDYIKGNGEITVKVDDKEYSFEITDITIKAEGSGVLFLEQENFKNKNVAVIDFGGLNMGFSLYRNCVVNPSERFIEEHGVKDLIIRVGDALTDLNNGNLITNEQAESALNNGYMKKGGEIDTESSTVIKKVKEKFLKDAIKLVEKRGFKLDQLDSLIFIGGTTQKLKEQISKTYPNNSIITNNSQWTTCEGLYKVAVAKYCIQ